MTISNTDLETLRTKAKERQTFGTFNDAVVMEVYAQTLENICQELLTLRSSSKTKTEMQILVDALNFYAQGSPIIGYDYGDKAKSALAELENK